MPVARQLLPVHQFLGQLPGIGPLRRGNLRDARLDVRGRHQPAVGQVLQELLGRQGLGDGLIGEWRFH